MSFFGKKKPKLGERLTKKLIAEFNIFFDIKKAGKLTWEDFEKLESHVLSVTGWQPDTAWWQDCQDFFKELWQLLITQSTSKGPQQISTQEWLEVWASVLKDKQEYEKKSLKSSSSKTSKIPKTEVITKLETNAPETVVNEKVANAREQPSKPVSQQISKQTQELIPVKSKEKAPGNGKTSNSQVGKEQKKDFEAEEEELIQPEEVVEYPEYFPSWTRKFFEYKFRLFDRSGDGCIDADEFEYVLWDGFGVGPSDCREAFKIITQDNEKTIDRRYFLELFIEYFFSDDPKPLGNRLNAKFIE